MFCYAWLQVPPARTPLPQAGEHTRWTVQKAQVCGDGFHHSLGCTAEFQEDDRVISRSPWNPDHVKINEIQ